MIGILPAAGMATRLGGLPKFLLPVGDPQDTLLRRHIEGMRPHVDQILIATRPENAFTLATYLDDKVTLLILETRTMSETVKKAISWTQAESFLLGLPDTLFTASDPYAAISENMSKDNDLVLALWDLGLDQRGQLGQIQLGVDNRVLDSVDKDPECEYRHFWGAMGFNLQILELVDSETPHLGYVIKPALAEGRSVTGFVQPGAYIDCGTQKGYRALQKFIVGF
jgi:NDP-sugar pyrophosphorylase family protein